MCHKLPAEPCSGSLKTLTLSGSLWAASNVGVVWSFVGGGGVLCGVHVIVRLPSSVAHRTLEVGPRASGCLEHAPTQRMEWAVVLRVPSSVAKATCPAVAGGSHGTNGGGYGIRGR